MTKESDRVQNEIWRDIPRWEGLYAASSLGRIKSLPRTAVVGGGGVRMVSGRVLKPYRKCRYDRVNLSHPNSQGQNQCYVHRLVCAAFHGEAPTKDLEVAHWDGDAKNNKSENLRWVDRLENALDKKRHGTLHAGVSAKPILTESDVRQIRSEARKLYREVAGVYNVSPRQIEKIVRHQAWRHIY